MKKVKAFSMIEMLITLIIGSIVIFICIGVFFNFNRYFERSIKGQGAASHFLWITSRLRNDFKTADSIVGGSEKLTFFSPIHKTEYLFNTNKIVLIRDSSKLCDSIHVQIKGVKIEYLSQNLVQSLNILATFNKISYNIYLYKDYPNKVKYKIAKTQ